VQFEEQQGELGDDVTQPWAIRSALAVVTDLERSVAFYRELGPFEELVRKDAVAILGEGSPASIALVLREARSVHARPGQLSLGLRSITFNVRSTGELDRIESVLRDRDLFTSRRPFANTPSELVFGRDPDNLPLVFVCYGEDETLGLDHYQAVADMAYSWDV
jgi:hypothetical protein